MTQQEKKAARSFAGIAGIVAAATLISKVFGLIRQQAVAAAFGVGAAATAYSYAYIIPGFLLILLGGVNGPLHSAIVSVLAKHKKEEHDYKRHFCLFKYACIEILTRGLVRWRWRRAASRHQRRAH